MTVGFEAFLHLMAKVIITALKGGLCLDGLFNSRGSFHVAPAN